MMAPHQSSVTRFMYEGRVPEDAVASEAIALSLHGIANASDNHVDVLPTPVTEAEADSTREQCFESPSAY
jgi:hypothetical protein